MRRGRGQAPMPEAIAATAVRFRAERSTGLDSNEARGERDVQQGVDPDVATARVRNWNAEAQ